MGDEDIEGRRTFNLQDKLDDPAFSSSNIVKEMHGNELNVAYFQRHGFNTPLLFKEKTGLGELSPVFAMAFYTKSKLKGPLDF